VYAAQRYFAYSYFGGIWPTALGVIQPARADLLLSTTAPIIQLTGQYQFQPDTANLILSNVAPTIAATANIWRTPPHATLLVDGSVPLVVITTGAHFVYPLTAQITLSSSAPTIEGGERLRPWLFRQQTQARWPVSTDLHGMP